MKSAVAAAAAAIATATAAGTCSAEVKAAVTATSLASTKVVLPHNNHNNNARFRLLPHATNFRQVARNHFKELV